MYFEPNKSLPFISAKQLSVRTGISIRTLCRMRAEGTGPKFHKFGPRKIVYRIEDVNQWLADRCAGESGPVGKNG
jgi:predicted DNA-binding transcriptional regulator AlpA